MKTIIVTIAAALLSLNAAAYNPGIDPDEYCVTKKNGKTVVEYQGKTITKDITLADGSKIKSNGTVVAADGTRLKLKDGECINADNISSEIKSRKEKDRDDGLFDRDKKEGDKDDGLFDRKKEGEDNWDKSKDYDRSDSEKDMDNTHPDRNKEMDVTDPDRNKDLNKQKDFDMKHPESKDSLKFKRAYK